MPTSGVLFDSVLPIRTYRSGGVRAPQPTLEDKFSFGLWTTGWQARDMFGEATRPVLAAVQAVWMSVIVHGLEGYFIVLVVAVLAGWYP